MIDQSDAGPVDVGPEHEGEIAEPDEQTGAEPVERRRRPRPEQVQSRWPVVLAVVLFVAVAGVGVGAFVYFDDDGGGGSTVSDDFSVASDDGLPAGELEWRPLTGTFTSSGGVARVGSANEVGPRTMTVADAGSTNGRLQVAAGTMTSGWGIIFRYVGPYNFWYVQAVSDYAVFNVVRVADGVAQTVGVTRLVQLRDGMTVDVVLAGANIEIRVAGDTVFQRSDDHALGGRDLGLLATTAAGSATWDRVSFTPDRTRPGPESPVLRSPISQLEPSGAADAEEPEPSSTTTTTTVATSTTEAAGLGVASQEPA